MKLRPDGIVGSVTVKSSTGYTELDEPVTWTLRAYRFKPSMKGSLLWLVSFLQPAR
jgi:outer membrane biosynthesis protein TonB